MPDFNRQELIDYFNEHILYELLMLRFSRNRLNAAPQILWNAMFSAFNVSARNLYEFLNNKGTRNEVNVHEYRDYSKEFRLSSITRITGTLQKINEQVFHMGRKRPKDSDKKVTLDRVELVFKWVDSNMFALVASFDEKFRNEVQMHRADPNYIPTSIMSGPTGPSAPTSTNHTTAISGPVLPGQIHTSDIAGLDE